MKLGIIGSGMIVKELLSITELLKNVELEAICDTVRSKEKVDGLKNEYV